MISRFDLAAAVVVTVALAGPAYADTTIKSADGTVQITVPNGWREGKALWPEHQGAGVERTRRPRSGARSIQGGFQGPQVICQCWVRALEEKHAGCGAEDGRNSDQQQAGNSNHYGGHAGQRPAQRISHHLFRGRRKLRRRRDHGSGLGIQNRGAGIRRIGKPSKGISVT